jgi:hypothetical protein
MQISIIRRAETRAISISAAPEVVLDFVADPRNLPRWAPSFAQAVEPSGEDWLIEQRDRQALISVRVSRDARTVDFLAATDHTRGAFTRVLPNAGGSEYAFTLFFDPDAEATAITGQMAVVEAELNAVRSLCEA